MSRRRPALHEHDGGGEEEVGHVEYSFFRKVAGLPRRFSLASLAAATDEFGCVVGRGSSGTVFRGVLDDGTAVAVKRLDGPSARLAEREFRAEAGAIGGAQHAGLVRLLGFCLVPHGGPRFLVYEYMEHGSLDKWIFPSSSSWLTWRQRRQVAVDVARALAYLHGDLRGGNKVVHLDVKPENILLDDAFRGVLSDFGLSTLMGKDQSRVVTTVRGTTGYLAPEWLLGVGVTDKSDVYSFGMVLLEMLGGRRNIQVIDEEADIEVVQGSRRRQRWSYFPKIVAEKVREGRVMEVVDPRVRGDAAADEAGVRRVAHVALWCAQEKASARPDMARVVEMLEAKGGATTEVEPPPPSEMILVDMLALDPDRPPFGLPVPPSSGVSSAMSRTDSFALSYLSGR
ncbi:hypothetical protein PR202_ga18193 [Eleusine coracana subsp. coracana]|uniref:Protein kinase domain-containing protein n=1 Tax=Eleusine coracana subsp. coracana TaxID=191504 RepID=A0AAV5CSH7_ELECO|nr:hypothetical protein PR202_ga18193 [Eleusine coracana subsp. coracana]